MTSISIVCDACGHHVLSAPNPRELVVASSDGPEADAAAGTARTVPNRCPCCGAVWDLLHPGDEFLIGLTNVNRAGHHRAFVARS
jgi:hypothetical protein